MENRAGAGYFTAAQRLPRGQIAISPLTLSQEQSADAPPVPIIYFSTPIYDRTGSFRGVVVSTVYASSSLQRLQVNQGQIYRFLPKPLSRELLRRSLQSAFDQYARTRSAPVLLDRYAVEEARFEPMSLSARLMDYWRRIRDNNRVRSV